MISRATRAFWQQYRSLPPFVRKIARKNYQLWRENPQHPSLHFKKVGVCVWSARITDDFRAIATPIEDGFLWYWIGPHDEYLQMIRR